MYRRAFRICILTFFVAFVVSLLSESISSASGMITAGLILVVLIVVSIVADGVGVSVTCANKCKIAEMELGGVKGAKAARVMVAHAELVNSICADLVGDICSIISGACGATIVVELVRFCPDDSVAMWISITMSSIIASLTVGGKSLVKSLAIGKSEDFIVKAARIISKFCNVEKLLNRKHKKYKNKNSKDEKNIKIKSSRKKKKNIGIDKTTKYNQQQDKKIISNKELQYEKNNIHIKSKKTQKENKCKR